ncbi:hypothetical protein GCM10010363_32690 [Streptomyces omiyaensis]|nr:hypothetical protein GCM10010363_32690 [Streptomyces omiyaensis]
MRTVPGAPASRAACGGGGSGAVREEGRAPANVAKATTSPADRAGPAEGRGGAERIGPFDP